MNHLVEALDDLAPGLTEALELCNTRDAEGGQPLIEFMDELDDLFPELAQLCERRWMLELVIRLCNMRGR